MCVQFTHRRARQALYWARIDCADCMISLQSTVDLFLLRLLEFQVRFCGSNLEMRDIKITAWIQTIYCLVVAVYETVGIQSCERCVIFNDILGCSGGSWGNPSEVRVKTNLLDIFAQVFNLLWNIGLVFCWCSYSCILTQKHPILRDCRLFWCSLRLNCWVCSQCSWRCSWSLCQVAGVFMFLVKYHRTNWLLATLLNRCLSESMHSMLSFTIFVGLP